MGCQSRFEDNDLCEKLLEIQWQSSVFRNLGPPSNSSTPIITKAKPLVPTRERIAVNGGALQGWRLGALDETATVATNINTSLNRQSTNTNTTSNNSITNELTTNGGVYTAATAASLNRNQPPRVKKFIFHHYDDIRRYIVQYRQEHSLSSSPSQPMGPVTYSSIAASAYGVSRPGVSGGGSMLPSRHQLQREPPRNQFGMENGSSSNGEASNEVVALHASNPFLTSSPVLGQDKIMGGSGMLGMNGGLSNRALNASYMNGILTVAQKYHLTPPSLTQYTTWWKGAAASTMAGGGMGMSGEDQQSDMEGLQETSGIPLHGKPVSLESKKRIIGKTGVQQNGGYYSPDAFQTTSNGNNWKRTVCDENRGPRGVLITTGGHTYPHHGNNNAASGNDGTTGGPAPVKIRDGNCPDFGKLLEEKLRHVLRQREATEILTPLAENRPPNLQHPDNISSSVSPSPPHALISNSQQPTAHIESRKNSDSGSQLKREASSYLNRSQLSTRQGSSRIGGSNGAGKPPIAAENQASRGHTAKFYQHKRFEPVGLPSQDQ